MKFTRLLLAPRSADAVSFRSVLARSALVAATSLYALDAATALGEEGWSQRSILPPPAVNTGAVTTAKPATLGLDESRVWPVVTAMAAHPTKPYLATAGDNHRIHLWQMPEGQLLKVFRGHGDWIRSLTFSPEGDELISGGNDGRILVWDARWDASHGHAVDRLTTAEVLESLAEGPSRELVELDFAISQIALSPDGSRLAVTGFGKKQMPILERKTGDLLKEVGCPCIDMRAVAFSPDGTTLAAAGRNGKVRVLRVADDQTLLEYQAHHQRVRELEFSKDGRELISSSEDGSVLLRALDAPVRSDGGRGGRLAADSVSLTAPTLDSDSSSSSGDDFRLRCEGMKILSMTQLDADRLALGGSDNSIRIFNRSTREEEAKLEGHDGSVAHLLVLQGRLVSGSFDTTIRFWDDNNDLVTTQR